MLKGGVQLKNLQVTQVVGGGQHSAVLGEVISLMK